MTRPKSSKTRRSRKTPVTLQMVREMALALPGVEEGGSYGTPAFRVNRKLFARFHQDGETLVLKVEFAIREVLMGANPSTFYLTDHYHCWPWVLVRLSNVDADELRGLLVEAWRSRASKRALLAWDARQEER